MPEKMRIRLEGPRENDFVFLTKEARKESPELAAEMASGGVVRKVDSNGVAEVHITTIKRVDITKLTTKQ